MSRNNISRFVIDIAKAITLTPAQVLTVNDIFDLGSSDIQGLDWDMSSTAAISLHWELLQSNGQLGPFAKWSATTLAGSTVTNDLVVVNARDGTDLKLTPGGYGKVKLTNNGTANLVIARLSFFAS